MSNPKLEIINLWIISECIKIKFRARLPLLGSVLYQFKCQEA